MRDLGGAGIAVMVVSPRPEASVVGRDASLRRGSFLIPRESGGAGFL
ncbi:Hypothetical protein CAP_6726 [Chondromyces apiculatus DSM 436]|uniref:Uncharacterized protein n=1 Tax=Chondromyces apiculatus DSM 436 TaxID=1192034 RepID=A0A017SZX1_9BACT|nr:Hypothetical protein CAP_6726 [Chondromyces apiculatus DSM 436]